MVNMKIKWDLLKIQTWHENWVRNRQMWSYICKKMKDIEWNDIELSEDIINQLREHDSYKYLGMHQLLEFKANFKKFSVNNLEYCLSWLHTWWQLPPPVKFWNSSSSEAQWRNHYSDHLFSTSLEVNDWNFSYLVR